MSQSNLNTRAQDESYQNSYVFVIFRCFAVISNILQFLFLNKKTHTHGVMQLM